LTREIVKLNSVNGSKPAAEFLAAGLFCRHKFSLFPKISDFFFSFFSKSGILDSTFYFAGGTL